MKTTKPSKGKVSPAAPTNSRLRGAPRYLGPAWKLSDREKQRFDNAHGVTMVFDKLHPKPHPDDRELLFNGLAAAISFHELSKLIDTLYWDDTSDEIREELEQIRVGFELSLQALDRALGDRAKDLDKPRLMAMARYRADPKSTAMAAILAAWDEMQAGSGDHLSDAAFARKMQAEYPVITSEGTIKNAISKRRKAGSSS